MGEKIVLGLSGGVDSAVAAKLLQEHYDVTGLYLDIGLGGSGSADAAAVAERLGIPWRSRTSGRSWRNRCAPPSPPTTWRGGRPCPAPGATGW